MCVLRRGACLLAALVLCGTGASAQLQQGAIRGIVVAPDGTPAGAAVVRLLDPLGVQLQQTASGHDGGFFLAGVAPGTYTLRAEAPPLYAVIQHLAVHSAVPLRVELRLSAVAADRITVQGGDANRIPATTRVTVAGEAARRAPSRVRSRGTQDAIAALAGWATEDNGLLHVRGVDDGFLYVIDGIPVYERLDGLFGAAPDAATIDSLHIITGYVPAEFGWKSGGIIEVRSAAGTAADWTGVIDGGIGSETARETAVIAGGPLSRTSSLTFGASRYASSRFLDPVHPDNLHNDGAAWNAGGQLGWSPSTRDRATFVFGASRSRFDVPHGEEQEEAGQDQRQRVGQHWMSASWQRTVNSATVSQLSAYHRGGFSRLLGSAFDTPLFTTADRTLHRTGLLGSVAHERRRHLLKAGGEASWLRLHEDFTFAVTNSGLADEMDLSEAALAFTPDHPFRFTGRARPSVFSLFAQDSIAVAAGVTFDAGVRADWSRLMAPAFQISPRAGLTWHLAAPRTTLRASFGRFFQPPQPENLLLSSSDAAWSLSPFREETGGGAPLQPERQTAFEIAFDQPIGRAMRIDVAFWHRSMRDVADPNVFFGTTILFPNSVAEGRASGFDIKLQLPRQRGWSAYANYAFGRVVQHGPISGGLFLEEEMIDIGPGTRFIPDHDQRHVGSFGVSFDAERPGRWISLTGRYESGTPLEVDDEHDARAGRPGAELVDFARGRVRPRTVLDVSGSLRLLRRGDVDVSLRAALLNLTGRRWAYNFGNPFSGTHFGPGRTLQAGLRVGLR